MEKVLAKYSLPIALWAVGIMFHSLIEKTIDRFLTIPIMATFNPTPFSDFMFLIMVATLTYKFIHSKFVLKRYLEWEGIFLISLFASFFYLYRYKAFGFTHWDFESLFLFETNNKYGFEIKYVDLILTIPPILILYKLSPPKIEEITEDKAFSLLDDSHIEDGVDDKLDRKELAQFIAKHIINTRSQRSFALGINGRWGDGKTSLQYLIAKAVKLHDVNAVIIKFNPWRSANERKIIKDFFETYGREIGRYDVRLGEQIYFYGRALLSSDKNRFGLSALRGLKSESNQFDYINSSIAKIKRKIIVFIDDLDRLSTKEVIEVVKLIRNSANFSHTFFIVGYDREYLNEALRKHNRYGRNNFLEKIFQVQFDLSQVDGLVIKNELHDLLVEKLPTLKSELNSVIYPQIPPSDVFASYVNGTPLADKLVPKILANIRDVKRFVNFFSLSIRQVSSEVIFGEYFYLNLLRFKYPTLVNQIRDNKNIYIEEILNPFQHQRIKTDKILELCKTLIIAESDQATIEHIFKELYKAPNNAPNRKSILLHDNFSIYYDNLLSAKGILFGDVTQLLEKPWTDVQKEVKAWIAQGNGQELASVLRDLDNFSSLQRFRLSSFIWVTLTNNIQDQDRILILWITQISSHQNEVDLLLGEEKKKFFEKLMMPSNEPFFFTTYLCRILLRKYINGETIYFPLSKEELQAISVKRLTMYVAEKEAFDTRVFNLFYYNCWESKDSNDRVRILSEANKIILEYILKYPKDYLRFTIRPKYGPHLDGLFVFEPFTPQYFGTWDAFEDFLKEIAENDQEFKEMIGYFVDFKKNSFSEFYSESPPKWISSDSNGNATMKHFQEQTFDAFLNEMKQRYNSNS